MIKISSFYPFSNLLRVTTEFHDEKALVKMRSLTFEREYEFNYEEVAEIASQSHVDISQMHFGFVLLVILVVAFAFFSNAIYARSLLFHAIRALYMISVILLFGSFIRSRYYYFLDKNKKVLVIIRATAKDYESTVNVIKWVGIKSKNLRQSAFDHPFLDSNPLFELTKLDVLRYFNKCQMRFYEDRFIRFDKNLLGASVSTYRYDQLSGEIYRGKQANSSWDSLLWGTLGFSMLTAGFYMAFDILPGNVFRSIMWILAVPLVISFLMKYVKHEIVAFCSKNNHTIYFTRVDQFNREKVEEIVRFVQSKIPPVTNNELVKEQE